MPSSLPRLVGQVFNFCAMRHSKPKVRSSPFVKLRGLIASALAYIAVAYALTAIAICYFARTAEIRSNLYYDYNSVAVREVQSSSAVLDTTYVTLGPHVVPLKSWTIPPSKSDLRRHSQLLSADFADPNPPWQISIGTFPGSFLPTSFCGTAACHTSLASHWHIDSFGALLHRSAGSGDHFKIVCALIWIPNPLSLMTMCLALFASRAAITYLVRRFRRRQVSGSDCRICGYSLTGLPHTLCPECGNEQPSHRHSGRRLL